jgi:hypothetical protein
LISRSIVYYLIRNVIIQQESSKNCSRGDNPIYKKYLFNNKQNQSDNGLTNYLDAEGNIDSKKIALEIIASKSKHEIK